MKKQIGIVVLVFCISLFGCNRDYRMYTDSDKRFSVKYPKSWIVKPGGQAGIAVTFESPMEGLSDNFLDNFSITAGSVPSSMTAEDFAHATMEAPKSYIPKFKIMEEKKSIISGAEAFSVVYEGDLAGEKFIWKQVFFVKKGQGYSVIFTLSADKAVQYDAEIKESIASFRIL